MQDPVVTKDLLNGGSSEFVSKIVHGVTDAGVAPGRALPCHSHNQFADLVGLRRSSRSTEPAAVVLPGDQVSAPPENRVRCHNAADLEKRLPSELAASRSEASALAVGESDPLLTDLFSEYLVLSLQVIDHLLLLAVDPSGGHDHEQVPRRDVHSGTISR